jgi:hypothetical protein
MLKIRDFFDKIKEVYCLRKKENTIKMNKDIGNIAIKIKGSLS